MANNCKQLMKGALDGALNEFRGLGVAATIATASIANAEDIPQQSEANAQVEDRNSITHILQPKENP